MPDSDRRSAGDGGSVLILARHSLVESDAAVPAHEWRLSEEGRRRCRRLAAELEPCGINRIISSEEAKAVETAEIAAAFLEVPCETAAGLHEHDRRGVGLLPAAEFRAGLRRFFLEPGRLVFGDETADACRARFSAAVDAVVARHPGERLCVVAHGTVMSLLAAGTGAAGYAFWESLGMPAFVALAHPALRVERLWEEPPPGLARIPRGR